MTACRRWKIFEERRDSSADPGYYDCRGWMESGATLKIREESSIPIIMLSAKSQDTDKILGLNLGSG